MEKASARVGKGLKVSCKHYWIEVRPGDGCRRYQRHLYPITNGSQGLKPDKLKKVCVLCGKTKNAVGDVNMLDLRNLEEQAMDGAKDAHVCKGLFYRGRVSSFLDKKGGYTYQERMVPLKRMSCPGCDQCEWLRDSLSESVSYGDTPVIKDIKDGAMYSLKVVNESRDFETGHIDSWDMEFVEVSNEGQKQAD